MNFQTLFSHTRGKKYLRMIEKQVPPNCQDGENKRLQTNNKRDRVVQTIFFITIYRKWILFLLSWPILLKRIKKSEMDLRRSFSTFLLEAFLWRKKSPKVAKKQTQFHSFSPSYSYSQRSLGNSLPEAGASVCSSETRSSLSVIGLPAFWRRTLVIAWKRKCFVSL